MLFIITATHNEQMLEPVGHIWYALMNFKCSLFSLINAKGSYNTETFTSNTSDATFILQQQINIMKHIIVGAPTIQKNTTERKWGFQVILYNYCYIWHIQNYVLLLYTIFL